MWVANTLNASVSKIDLSSGEVLSTIPVGSEPAGIAAGGGSIWVANQGDGTVYRLDERTSVTTIPVGQGPYDVAVGLGHVWVSDEYANAVAEVDPVKLAVIRTTKTNSAPLGLALAGDRLWVATDGIGAIPHRGRVLYALASGFYGVDGWRPTGDRPRLRLQLRPVAGARHDERRSRRLPSLGGVAGTALVQDLAAALPTPTDNGRTYTFRIRSGIRYSNGMSLRASDFRRGLERAFKVGGGPAFYLAPILGGDHCVQHPASCDLSHGIVADDAANTVTIHLAGSDADLLHELTLPAAYPVPPGTALRVPARSVPGTGPYRVAS